MADGFPNFADHQSVSYIYEGRCFCEYGVASIAMYFKVIQARALLLIQPTEQMIFRIKYS